MSRLRNEASGEDSCQPKVCFGKLKRAEAPGPGISVPNTERAKEAKPAENVIKNEASVTFHQLRVTKDSGVFVKGMVETMPIEWLVDIGCTTTIVIV